MVAAVQSVDRKLLFIPMIFILLRMWGTLQFFYSLIISKHLQCGCVPTNLHIGFLVFGYLHVSHVFITVGVSSEGEILPVGS